MLIGIVGKPSCGKSTFFKAATLAEVEIASYPFTTIKPNHGVGFIRVECTDRDFNVKCKPKFGYCINSTRFVPIALLDVAGLVPGAHEGKGLGLEFLNDLNEADMLIHIVDISGSTNEKGENVEPLSYNPINDIEFLEHELDMWYFQIMKKGWDKFARIVKQENQEIKKALAKQLSGVRVTEEMVEVSIKKLDLIKSQIEWNETDLKSLAGELRRLSKPTIIAANKIDIQGAEKNLEQLKDRYKDLIIIPCSSDSELALREAAKKGLIEYIPGDSRLNVTDEGKLTAQQKKALDFIRENMLEKFGSTGIQQVLDAAVFTILKHIAVFPVPNAKLADKEGNILPDCFLVPEGETALGLAFRIHQEIGKNFIRAVNIRTKQVIGKDYKLKHLDVIEIVSGG